MQEHVTEKLSAYLNHELPKEDRQTVGEHLLQCENCRNEFDEIKSGAALASQLHRADAPADLWTEIENALDGGQKPQVASIPYFAVFNSRGLTVAAAALLIAFGLMTAIYFGSFKNEPQEIVKDELPVNQSANIEFPQTASTPFEISTNQNTTIQIPSIVNSNDQIQPPPNTNSNVQPLPKINPIQPPSSKNQPNETIIAQNNSSSVAASWNVETISGTPKSGAQTISQTGKLAVGQFLETDANSRARVQVANIGQVEIAPNSRVQLVKTHSTEHRLSLERGVLQAKILAPPRLFIVDTPSAVAVDLGCEYTLEVDNEGNSKLHVTSGYVALERGGRESIVPAGAKCLTKKGKGLGTPFSDDSSVNFQNALARFDFQNGGSEAVQTIIDESAFYDSLSLWHLLSRTRGADREKVFDALAKYVKPPAGATREGVLKLNKKMLDGWWTEIENVWFE